MRALALLLISSLLAALAACTTPPATPLPGLTDTYRLVSLGGAPFAGVTTLSFDTPGQISGMAPCNRYAARLIRTPTGLTITSLTRTEMACFNQPVEDAFFAMLSQMTRIDTSPTEVVFSGPQGPGLIFRLQP